MATPSRQAVLLQPAPSVVRAHLECILASPSFSRSERLSKFLAFVVEETLAGRAESLKEQVIGAALYSQDVGSDSVVRVDARRLRDKLREYYAESPNEPLVITLPKGSYVPHFEVAAPQAAAAAGGRSRMWLLWLAGCVALAAAAISVFRRAAVPLDEVTPIPLTSFTGFEDAPSLSPDGNFVAFGWSGPDGRAMHVYVKAVRGDALRQLTNGNSENLPSWSPDGRYIAFIRSPQRAYVVSALGGAERLVSEKASFVTWSGDSKSVLTREPGPNGPHGIVQISVDTLERRQLTQAPVGDGEWRFAVSPDGKNLAFIRYNRSGVSDLYVMPLPSGEPRRITNWGTALGGLAWMPDGRELVYAVQEPNGRMGLWRIHAGVRTPGRGRHVPGIETNANHPTLSRPVNGQGARLAYVYSQRDIGLRLVNLKSLGKGIFDDVRRVADSSRGEQPHRLSADGSRVAFASDRDGEIGMWICGRDGSGLRKLGLGDGTIAFSPDAASIAFDAVTEGNTDLYTVSTNGGLPRRLTSEPSIDGTPEWSRDGKWIYFMSTRNDDKPQLFKIPSGGGAPVQLTHNGGFRPRESPDGQFLYYLDRLPLGMNGRGRLMRVPAGGGNEELILDDVGGWTWDASGHGIMFLAVDGNTSVVNLYRFADAKVVRLGALPFRPARMAVGWAVSFDGSWLLTNQVDGLHSDLMFVDNFR